MRVLVHNGSAVWGGNEKWMATVAAGLRDRGHQVLVSCRAEGPVRERLEGLGIRTTPVRPRGDLDPVSALRFALLLRRQRPDALLDTTWKRLPWVSRAARWAGVGRVVVRLGIVRSLPPAGRHTRAFRRRVDALIVNSDEIRREWLRSAPWFPARAVHVVHNGVRPAPPLPPGRRARLRAELGVPADAPLVVGVGHVYPRKGFDLLIAALAAAPHPDARALVVGSGPEVESLRALAARLGVADRVHWAGFRDDVPEVVAAGDLFVLSSRNEGMANVMLEAMAAGTPVVAADVSGVRYAIGAEEGEAPAGWIVPPEDADALSRAMGEVLRDLRHRPDAVRARVEEARRRVAERFGVERMVAEVEAVLRGSEP